MNLLPQMRPKDLDQRDLQRGDLAMHEDPRQVQLHLKPHIHIGTVDGGGPPQREASIRYLVETTALRVGQLFVLHRLLEPRGLLPEQPFPGGEVGALEKGVLQDPFYAAQGLDDVRAVVVEVPQLAIVALVRPPEGVLLQHLWGRARGMVSRW